MMYYVYIIQNPQGRRYIGLTDNLERRLQDHNTGISKWTRLRGPWKIVWSKSCADLTEARKLENLLKRQKGGRGLARLTGLDL